LPLYIWLPENAPTPALFHSLLNPRLNSLRLRGLHSRLHSLLHARLRPAGGSAAPSAALDLRPWLRLRSWSRSLRHHAAPSAAARLLPSASRLTATAISATISASVASTMVPTAAMTLALGQNAAGHRRGKQQYDRKIGKL
jgi:hypothetical protein